MGKRVLGEQPWFDETAEIIDSRLGRYTAVHQRTEMIESSLGDYSYVMENCDIIYADIGKFCSIASNVRINPGNHPLHRATAHHFTYRSQSYGLAEADEAEFFGWRRQHKVTIGHDVWIGHGAIVLPGRVIGTGAAVGAGSVVTKDVAPYTVVAGNPARVIRRRFPEAVAAGLMQLAWWDWSHDKLREALDDFRRLDAAAFVAKHQG